ncbi:unnamed protein product [Triticum turgidum subsp. durum]|uniref:Protein kinase domain-containing protein n=1 Tax=Triticum turgidum subsp. durum TaxID=4567 RepID=A0A9R0Y8K5_TRITD|nr:unnamed protein product [Triticum turgidum subsp. durum]
MRAFLKGCFYPRGGATDPAAVADGDEATTATAKATAPPRPSAKKTKKKSMRRAPSATARLRTLSFDNLSRTLASSGMHAFTVAELRAATRNFSGSHFIGEGGFGPVYKGFLDDKVVPGMQPQHVAVKYLDAEGPQGHREWLAEVVYLGMQLSHEHHLFKNLLASLPWATRLKIAVGAAKGLAFLHEAETPVIYRDFKASNILLESDYTAKLSDFGLAKEGPSGDDTHVSTRVMGTHGYAAPEYILTGHLTARSDVYSFGVVLLELLTGRRSVDKRRRGREQNLVDWARPYLRRPDRLHRVMDPSLEGSYSAEAAAKAATVAYNCLHSVPKNRPTMREVVDSLEPLMRMSRDVPAGLFVYTAPSEPSPVAKAVADKADVAAEAGEEAKDGGASASAAAARKKCQRSAVHAESAAPKYASSVAAGNESRGSPRQRRDRGA